MKSFVSESGEVLHEASGKIPTHHASHFPFLESTSLKCTRIYKCRLPRLKRKVQKDNTALFTHLHRKITGEIERIVNL